MCFSLTYSESYEILLLKLPTRKPWKFMFLRELSVLLRKIKCPDPSCHTVQRTTRKSECSIAHIRQLPPSALAWGGLSKSYRGAAKTFTKKKIRKNIQEPSYCILGMPASEVRQTLSVSGKPFLGRGLRLLLDITARTPRS